MDCNLAPLPGLPCGGFAIRAKLGQEWIDDSGTGANPKFE